MKLFSATSKMKSQKWGELTIYWFVSSRPEQEWDPAQFVAADPLSDRFIKHNAAVREHFTEEELKKFQEYLKRVHNDELTVKEFEPYPADKGIMPVSYIGEGQGDRLIDMRAEEGFDLPFGVCGHYYIFEHRDYPDAGDPDMDLTINAEGLIETAGGDPVGVTDKDILEETDPIKLAMAIKSIIESRDKNNEDFRNAPRP